MSTISEPSLNWKEFGEYVAAVRKKKGMNQSEFAKRMGIHQPDVSVIEKGTRQSTVETIFKIAEALNLSPQKLFAKFQKT